MPSLRPHIYRAAQWFATVAVLVLLTTPTPAAQRIIDNLFGCSLANNRDGWVVGGFGAIYRTDDGGLSWHPQVSNSTEQLFSVDFVDTKNGWIVGRSGLILATTNGGGTWTPQTSGTTNHLFKVDALDPLRVWAVGDWGTVLATQDGGKTWENHSLDRDVILNSQSWPDPQHGWIVGEAGTILSTSDGGATWSDQKSGVEKTLFGVFFENPQSGWACGIDGLILHTADGGQSWQVQHGDAAVGALEQVGFAEALGNPSIYDIMVRGKHGYAVGDSGTLLASDDSGQTWYRQALSGESNLRWMRALSIVPGTHGLLVGANGLTVSVIGGQIQSPEQDPHAAQAVH